MLKIEIDSMTYYVGSGKDLRRLWKRALKHGFKNGYEGYETSMPKYNPNATYAIVFIPRMRTMYWHNFNSLCDTGHISGKIIPNYRKYKGNMEEAKANYDLAMKYGYKFSI